MFSLLLACGDGQYKVLFDEYMQNPELTKRFSKHRKQKWRIMRDRLRGGGALGRMCSSRRFDLNFDGKRFARVKPTFDRAEQDLAACRQRVESEMRE